MKKILITTLLLCSLTLFAESSTEETGLSIGLSNETIDGQNYQSISLMPELDMGFVGIGLNLDVRFALVVDETEPTFEIYENDWVLDDGDFQDYLSLYLSKLAYLRLGHKEDGFYARAGQLAGTTLGNGTIVSDYTNMQYMPETTLFGAELALDGDLLNFPYLGFETFVSNVAKLDLVGGRLYVRPFTAFGIPVISNIEIGATGVMDSDPYVFSETTTSSSDDTVIIYGGDVVIPIIDLPVLTFDLSGDLVVQDDTTGQIYGAGGKLIKFIDYRLEYMITGEDYINDYFNSAYDLNRTGDNFETFHDLVGSESYEAGQNMGASVGFNIANAIYFNTELTGILTLQDETPDMDLQGTLTLDQDLLKIFSAEFSYLKTGIDTLDSVVDPEDAVIGGELMYHSGNMVVSFVVDVKYNADEYEETGDPDDMWITNTQIAVEFEL